MLHIYLYTARILLNMGHKDEGLKYLGMALGECNKAKAQEYWYARRETQHVMAALSYAKRIQA